MGKCLFCIAVSSATGIAIAKAARAVQWDTVKPCTVDEAQICKSGEIAIAYEVIGSRNDACDGVGFAFVRFGQNTGGTVGNGRGMHLEMNIPLIWGEADVQLS